MPRRDYPSDLTDAEWRIVEPLIPPANAIVSVDRTGCQWRALPHDFPPWSTIWNYFRTWPSDWDVAAHAYGIARAGTQERGP